MLTIRLHRQSRSTAGPPITPRVFITHLTNQRSMRVSPSVVSGCASPPGARSAADLCNTGQRTCRHRRTLRLPLVLSSAGLTVTAATNKLKDECNQNLTMVSYRSR